MSDFLILVNQEDQALGLAEKLYAHQQGLCHRAFSVFVLRENQGQIEILLQQRALHKYHSPGLWTNTCCSHPRPGENISQAAARRLSEELGLSLELAEIGLFHYIAHFDNGLIENEMDHVLMAWYQGEVITPQSEEVAAIQWMSMADLCTEIRHQPEKFTPWLENALLILRQDGLHGKQE